MTHKKRKNELVVHLDTARVLPQDVDLERVVLGAFLVDKDAFDRVSDVLSEDSFYDSRHKLIFSAIKSMKLRSIPVDMLTLAEQLKREGKLEEVGGPVYISDLSRDVASSANVEYHSRILAQKEKSRNIITLCAYTSERAFNEEDDIDNIHEKAERQLYEISQKGISSSAVELISSIAESIKLLQLAQAKTDGVTGVPSGFESLDNMTAGFQNTDLIILAGRPAMGKTAFALNMAWNIVVQNIPVAFFSLEMSRIQLTNRIVSSVCEIPGNKILRGDIDEIEWGRIDSNISAMNRPLFIDDTPGLSIFQLRSKARFLVRVKGVKIILIDYMQLMNVAGEDYNTRQEQVSIISRSLKALAKELNVPIIALSQLNRGVESREGEAKRPRLSDLRDSGSIEQDADMVLFVHRPEYYHIYQDENGRDLRGKAQIIIAKHRNGATGDVDLCFQPQFTRFTETEPSNISNISILEENLRVEF